MADILAAFIDAHVGLGLGTPGGLDPLDLDVPNPVTDLVYDSLPETYRALDAVDDSTTEGWPLYGFLDACAEPLVEALDIAGDIAGGALTDPSLAIDEWIPWLARAAGVTGVGVEAQRTQLANLYLAPPLGSRRFLEVVAQPFLTGTKYVQVSSAEPWGIQVRVRADEITAVGGSAGLAAAMYGTGLVPAGFLLQVVTEEQTWAQIQLPMPTWAPGEGETWARLMSMGLAGAGYATGSVNFGSVAGGQAGPLTGSVSGAVAWAGAAVGTIAGAAGTFRFGPATGVGSSGTVVPNSVKIGAETHSLDGTNVARGENELIMYTRDAYTATPTNQYGVEVVVNSTSGVVESVNNRLANSSQVGTTIPVGRYVLSGHGSFNNAYAGDWLLANAVVGAIVQLVGPGSGDPGTPPPATGGLPALPTKVISMWANRWLAPQLSAYPADVSSKLNVIVAAIAQSGSAGTGILNYSIQDGQTVAQHKASIEGYKAAGKPVLIGIGGSSDGGITITTNAQADQAYNSIVGFVQTYGFSGLDIDLEPSGSSWSQSALVYLIGRLKSTYGTNFIIGVTPGLYSTHTARWMALYQAAAAQIDYVAPMLYDFPEATTAAQLGPVTRDKCVIMANAGIPQSKMIMGYMLQPYSGYPASPNTTVIQQAYDYAKANGFPNLRGAFLWVDDIAASGTHNWSFPRNFTP